MPPIMAADPGRGRQPGGDGRRRAGRSRSRGAEAGPRWRCSVQTTHVPARCQACNFTFEPGAVRICSARARAHPRYWHAGCVSTPLGRPENIEGFLDLTAEQQQKVMPFLLLPSDPVLLPAP